MTRLIFLSISLIVGINRLSAQQQDSATMKPAAATIPGCDSARAWYYSVDGKYPMASSSLLSEVQAFTSTLKEPAGSGYITIRFTVTCRGLIGTETELLQTDTVYQPVVFNKTLTDRLTAFVRTLDKWNIATYQNGKPLAYRAFMTFKINDGKVTNVIP